jgi:hypothetical protein
MVSFIQKGGLADYRQGDIILGAFAFCRQEMIIRSIGRKRDIHL